MPVIALSSGKIGGVISCSKTGNTVESCGILQTSRKPLSNHSGGREVLTVSKIFCCCCGGSEE